MPLSHLSEPSTLTEHEPLSLPAEAGQCTSQHPAQPHRHPPKLACARVLSPQALLTAALAGPGQAILQALNGLFIYR